MMYIANFAVFATFLLLLRLGFGKSDEENIVNSTQHVCIVGGGIAGASTAHFLSLLKLPPQITVFEKSPMVGGRVHSFVLEDLHSATIEAGASIISSANILMAHFASTLNLTTVSKGASTKFVLWNGTHVLMESSERWYVNIGRMFLRYGISPLRSRQITAALLNSFRNVYPSDITAHDCPGYATVQALLQKTRLFNLTQVKFSDFVTNKLSQRFTNEIVSAITRVNYGQDVHEMNGLSGNIALAGSGANLWAVHGGNVQILSRLFKESGATIRLNSRVETVVRRQSGGYILKSEEVRGKGPKDIVSTECDAVVMTAPVELAGIHLPSDIDVRMRVDREFCQTVATFVSGNLSSKFGTSVAGVLTVQSATAFTSIGRVGGAQTRTGAKKPSIWKIFSKENLGNETLSNLFEDGWEVKKTFNWMAYPKFKPPEMFASFDVDPINRAFFYTSPIESAGSALEMSAIAGANAASLVRDRLGLRKGAFPQHCTAGGDFGKTEL